MAADTICSVVFALIQQKIRIKMPNNAIIPWDTALAISSPIV
jgi:hypothetical protein